MVLMPTVDLRLGDCLDIMRTLPAESVDAVVTSPPYPGAAMWNSDSTVLQELCEAALRESQRVTREGGVICWQVGDIPNGNHGVITTTTTTTYAALELGLKLRGHIIWDKACSHLTPPCFMRRPIVGSLTHESVLVFYKGDWKPREKQSGLQGDKKWMTTSVWRIAPCRDKDHPAPFPYELARRMVSLWSLEGDTILDPFMGSGTTGVACVQTGRSFIGIEIEPRYYEMAQRRIAEAQMQPTLIEEVV